MIDKAYLILEDGQVFEGKAFGAKKDILGEVVFSTGMTGYLETITDPSFYGQIVVQTFPLLGDYGVIPADFEADNIALSAYIVKNWCQEPSNFRSEGNIDTFFKQKGIVGLYDIDTRSLTKRIREKGVMNGKIVYNLEKNSLDEIKAYKIIDAVNMVTTKKVYVENAKNAKYNVSMLDLGLKKNQLRELVKRGCNVTVYPANSSVNEILKNNPDGIMVSNGPGDPEENVIAIKTIQELMTKDIPIFGICLGHQVIGLAAGFKREKMKYGHRGGNQPVKNLETDRVYITSQNHGYCILSDSINKKIAKELYVNVNDKSNEGIRYLNAPVLTVQFHPEACAGPKDTEMIFDEFIDMMEVKKKCR